jgi:hypothetical protein
MKLQIQPVRIDLDDDIDGIEDIKCSDSIDEIRELPFNDCVDRVTALISRSLKAVISKEPDELDNEHANQTGKAQSGYVRLANVIGGLPADAKAAIRINVLDLWKSENDIKQLYSACGPGRMGNVSKLFSELGIPVDNDAFTAELIKTGWQSLLFSISPSFRNAGISPMYGNGYTVLTWSGSSTPSYSTLVSVLPQFLNPNI